MALTDLSGCAPDATTEVEAVDRRLEALRLAIDEARRNGWRESDRLGADLEEYLSAVRLAQRDVLGCATADNPWCE